MTACQTYRKTHGEPEQWAPGEIEGYLDAMDIDRAENSREDNRKEGKGDGQHR